MWLTNKISHAIDPYEPKKENSMHEKEKNCKIRKMVRYHETTNSIVSASTLFLEVGLEVEVSATTVDTHSPVHSTIYGSEEKNGNRPTWREMMRGARIDPELRRKSAST